MAEDLCFWTAVRLRDAIARREISPVDVTRAVLERAMQEARTRHAWSDRRRSRLAGWTWSGSKGVWEAIAPLAISSSMDWQGRMPGMVCSKDVIRFAYTIFRPVSPVSPLRPRLTAHGVPRPFTHA